MLTNENQIYVEIKKELVDNQINKKVKDYSKNKYELEKYYNVGKLLSNAGKHYGDGVIKRYAVKLTKELDKKYNQTNLKRYRQFYWIIEKGARLGHQLSWSHYRELIPLKDINIINYYVMLCEKSTLTRDALKGRIKSKEYDRLPERTKEKSSITDFIKDPIIIKTNSQESISEKVLQKCILEDIEHFMQQLGESFSFIGSQYKIKIGNVYNYIDLLLFNIGYNCYVVIELK